MKRCFYHLGLVALVLCLSACSPNQAEENDPQTYSIVTQPVSIGQKNATAYDLSFLTENGQTISDSCWIGANQLLILTTTANTADNEAANSPQATYLYMLYTGDSTLELLYSGEHYLSELQNLSSNQVAIVSPIDLTILDYSNGQVIYSSMIDDPDNLSSPLQLASNGKYYAINQAGTIEILTQTDSIARSIAPEDLGYAWLSEPIWSADNIHLAFFCGHQEYGIDDIAIINMEDDSDIRILEYTGNDAYPYWSDLGNELLILNNFHFDRDVAKNIDIYNLTTDETQTAALKTPYTGNLALVFANSIDKRYYFLSEGVLYLQRGDEITQLTDESLDIGTDNISFSLSAKSAALFGATTESETVYILDLSE